jgi:hypothetical protein
MGNRAGATKESAGEAEIAPPQKSPDATPDRRLTPAATEAALS